jgi:transcriptional regulator with XRE-family HTH domain
METDFKKWILPLIDQQDYKVKTFCGEVNISRQAYYQYLSGTMKPTEPVYRKICQVLNVDVVDSELVTRTGHIGRPKLSKTV